jgi:DNA-binding LacI/PurR family transcriptional regulator
MEELPKRTSLVYETAAALKRWISTGILSDTLPGERELKERLGVSRETLRLALGLLSRDGWLAPAIKGRHRRVQIGRLPPRETAVSARLPVTFLSPFSPVHRNTLLDLEDLRMRLAEQGRSLSFLAPGIFHLENVAGHLERLVHEHPSAAWLLYATGPVIERWFYQRRVPTFVYGSPPRGVKLPFVANDFEAAVFHAGIQLVRQGHRIIGMLECGKPFPALRAAERGLQRALSTAPAQCRVIIFKDDISPPSVARSLESAFKLRERPTALILTSAAQALTCFSWLASRGIRTPGDISIVCTINDAWFTEFHPPLSHYRSNCRIIARQIGQRVMDLINNGQIIQKSLRVQLEYVPGATIGPVPARR